MKKRLRIEKSRQKESRDANLEVCVTIYVSGLDQSRGAIEEEPGEK